MTDNLNVPFILTTPLITVVIPTRDRQAKILRCLESLVQQTATNFEVIVVNDGSADQTQVVLAEFAEGNWPFVLQVINHPQPQGANPSRNEAIRAAKGDLIAFLDDDCTADSRWLEELQKPFGHANIAATSGHVDNTAVSNLWERFFIGQHRVSSRKRDNVFVANRIVAGNMLVCRSHLRRELDVDRADVDTDVATSARGDEEGLRIDILRAGKLIAHVPAAICYHDHPYRFRSFCRQAFRSGRSTARLGRKYRLTPRWELLALAAATICLPLAVWRIEFAVLGIACFALFAAAVVYNELRKKRKTIGQTIQTLPALLIYYGLRTIGYVKTMLSRRT